MNLEQEEKVVEKSVGEEPAEVMAASEVSEDAGAVDVVVTSEEIKTEEVVNMETDGDEIVDEITADLTAESETQASPKKRTLREKWKAFQQTISVGHVVIAMVCVLVLLMTVSFTVQALRPVPEPEPEPPVEEEQPKVILLAKVSSGYIPTISEINAEVSEHTSYDTMLTELQCWVKEFGRINIREESNTDSRVIGYVVYGDTLSMYGTEGDFTKVKYTDHQTGELGYGYCYTAFLAKEKPDTAKIFLDVPLYKQRDSRWGSKMIGGYETLASAGCTTTCISMVESYVHGQDIYPNMIADQLPYTYDGLLTFPGRYTRYAGKDYLQVILKLLHSDMPCLVSGYTSDGRTHWVVVVGYNGNGVDMDPADFVINDPGGNRFTLAEFFQSYPLFEKIVYYTG